MFTEDKIKKLIQENGLKEHNVSYLVQFDRLGDVQVIETIINEDNYNKLSNKNIELNNKVEKFSLDVVNLESIVDDLSEEISLLENN